MKQYVRKTGRVFFFALMMTFAPNAYGQQVADAELVYKTVGDVSLKLHVFNPDGHKTSDKRPAIVFFHGGGWSGGKPNQFFPHSEYLASRGMVAISVEYRLKTRHNTTPKESLKDAKSAMRWVREHSAELGVDPSQILAGGGSAGGHLAAATATAKGFNDSSDNLEISERPTALVLFNAVYDNSIEGSGYDRVKDYWQDFSPMHNISKKTPPAIVFLGSEDHHIPVATAEKFKRLMEEKGVRSDLHVYEGQPHGFFNANRNEEYYKITVAEMDRFLVSLGFLEDNSQDTYKGSKDKLHVYLLIGQSNMAGRADFTQEESSTIERAYLLNGKDEWGQAMNPLNRYSTIRKRLGIQKVNPGYTFTQAMLNEGEGVSIGLVVNAKGGTKIEEWAKGTEFYNEAVRRTKIAQKNGTLKGILWHQGEGNSRNADSYMEKLKSLIANLRADLGAPDLPFVAGQVFYDVETKPHTKAINDVIAQLPQVVPHTGYARSQGLTTKDNTHYNLKSMKLFGERYAKEMLSLQKK